MLQLLPDTGGSTYMNRIDKAFSKGKAFIGFLTGGDPDIDTTERLILAMEKAGADLIEIGIPFSDPIAEGPVIQAADLRALKDGTTTDKLFDMVSRLRVKTDIPLVFMTYINPIYTYGKSKFMAECKRCGIDGVIVPDLPYEEKDEIYADCEDNDVTLVSMIAPTSDDRVTMIASEAKGFLYCVSSLGVTGVRSDLNTHISELIDRVREVSDIPCAIGFGISTPEQAAIMGRIGDGVIVGSAIVKIIEKYGRDSVPYVEQYVRDMKKA